MSTTFRREINWAAIGKTTPITPSIKAHLVNVYTTLAATILCAAIGSLFNLMTGFGGLLSCFIGIGLIIWLFSVPEQELNKRFLILMGFAFAQGISVGPLLNYSIELNPSIVTTAFFGTVGIFACFSASAYYAERRSYLFLGGILGSALSALTIIGFLNIFFRSPFMYNISLYVGLLVFCGFVCFDTQLIIEKAAMGHKDVIVDSLELFLDFVSIFIRLVIILSKKEEKKSNKR